MLNFNYQCGLETTAQETQANLGVFEQVPRRFEGIGAVG